MKLGRLIRNLNMSVTGVLDFVADSSTVITFLHLAIINPSMFELAMLKSSLDWLQIDLENAEVDVSNVEKHRVTVVSMETLSPSMALLLIELKKQSSCSVQLNNKTDNHVAFKVKTTKPKKYYVIPNIGVINPNSACEFSVLICCGHVTLALWWFTLRFKAKAQTSMKPTDHSQTEAPKLCLDGGLSQGVLDYSEFRDVDMVIGAVIENVPLKQKIFSENEKVCPPHCILATNTSTIDLNLVGEKIKSQDRVVGAHFFRLAHVMPLLEIVRTEKTSAQVILDFMTFGKIIKKSPVVVVGNCTGFAVNRTFFPYTQVFRQLFCTFEHGNQYVDLETLCDCGLQDLAGYGVAIAVGKEFANAFPDRTFRAPIVDLLIKSGRNGKNNGKGYYLYEKGSKPKPDPQVFPIIEEAKRQVNIMPGGKPISITDKEVVEMILFAVVNEACRVIEEGVVVRASDHDVASVLGMSFPSYRGGIVFWGDLVGAKHIYESLKWPEKYSNFYKPSRFLEERARNGVPLSAPLTISASSRSRM
ncbi:enoyl-CoA hydratase/isomerase family [Artemisia annua]|uniref:Enoyl-CoA hydratase/isomerase family n=1 Tax=Artemisia annua TaxID=35608 RepID=A0A2U1MY94_ARTAN|nr:enoyl-CoA hydratase/isomerase family [Artemisia annua]